MFEAPLDFSSVKMYYYNSLSCNLEMLSNIHDSDQMKKYF